MVKHKKIYLDYFGYGEQDYIPCEYCTKRAVDVHHLERRGMGGSKDKDRIENLMGLCRECHTIAEANPKFNEMLKKVHLKTIKATFNS